MSLRFLSAPLIFTATGEPVENGVLVLDGNTVQEVLTSKSNVPSELIELFQGALCPGFVNAHCHLELSHLKNKITPHTGLTGFIAEIVSKRMQFSEMEILSAADKADQEMVDAGIVAVGDICNTAHTIDIKKRSTIYYHSFVELFDLDERNALSVYDAGKSLCSNYLQSGLVASLTPHAPYSVSPSLMRMLLNTISGAEIISIHSQETPSERDLFQSSSGQLADMFRTINPNYIGWQGHHPSSLAYILSFFKKDVNLQLVHNTFTSEKDLPLAMQSAAHLYWCMCARANEYIESAFPPIELLDQKENFLTVGTDSYASNHSLSVLDELIFISETTSHLSVEKLLKMATLNGARFLKIENRFGSFEKGKTPGVNWIKNIDLNNKKLTKSSSVQKIA